MPTDKEMLDWIDSTVYEKGERGRGVRFYWGHAGGGFRLMECEDFEPMVFPTVRESIAAAMKKAERPDGSEIPDCSGPLTSSPLEQDSPAFSTVEDEQKANAAEVPYDMAETTPSCPVDEESGEVDGLPNAGPVRVKHGPAWARGIRCGRRN